MSSAAARCLGCDPLKGCTSQWVLGYFLGYFGAFGGSDQASCVLLFTHTRYNRTNPWLEAGELAGTDTDLLHSPDVLLLGKVIVSCCFLFPVPKAWSASRPPSCPAGQGQGAPAPHQSCFLQGLALLVFWQVLTDPGKADPCSPPGVGCSARQEGHWGAEVSLHPWFFSM